MVLFLVLLILQMVFVVSETGSDNFFKDISLKTNNTLNKINEYNSKLKNNKYLNPINNIHKIEKDERILHFTEYSFYAFDALTNPIFLAYDFLKSD